MEVKDVTSNDEYPPISLLVFQASPFCNIDCDYCYLPSRSNLARINLETIERTIASLLNDEIIGNSLSIVWHAGEPLTVPISFYDAALTSIRKQCGDHIKIQHSFQTNGTLINRAWIDFFNRWNINLGISMDGPCDIHDAHRRTRTGRGTHSKVMKSIDLLRRENFPFHIISVVTKEALSRPQEFIDFFIKYGLTKLGLNFEELEGIHCTSLVMSPKNSSNVKKFLELIYKKYKQTGRQLEIREFESALQSITRGSPGQGAVPLGNEMTRPFGIVSVAYDGNFSTFSPELLGQDNSRFGDFIFGSVYEGTILNAFEKQNFLAVANEIGSGIKLCANQCQYFWYCGGGAPSNKFYENGSFASAETHYCRYMIQYPIDILLKDLELELVDA